MIVDRILVFNKNLLWRTLLGVLCPPPGPIIVRLHCLSHKLLLVVNCGLMITFGASMLPSPTDYGGENVRITQEHKQHRLE